MRRTKNKLALAVCICFALACALACIFIALNADHDCVGEHCEICASISGAARMLKLLKTACASALPLLAGLLARLAAPRARRDFACATPVSLRVQLNR